MDKMKKTLKLQCKTFHEQILIHNEIFINHSETSHSMK